ncbi:tetraacyldisaccharide 4'-kinase [Cytophaga hutchinsonii]|uniref:tetraacyldisaccharide 4'-kinase n=1 Tax=Cytophaga hutchinsonii TaxID=985 RepID=UPI001EE46DBE|nr:tetraacyldisaccharide 4'-kinase [Cytophaga hutchinsonii]
MLLNLHKQDKDKVIFLKILLLPFSLLYGGITAIRNYAYDKGWYKSYTLPVAVVCVGNIKAGGTGKTPFTQLLLQQFAGKYKTAVLSRGYGRKTKGFVLATAASTSAEIGDEPLQLYTHAQGVYAVAVCEDRVAGVEKLLQLIPDLKLVILDDGFQHRRINRDVNILLTEYQAPFYADWVLPAGRLREFRNGATRADAVVVTKTPAHAALLKTDNILRHTAKAIPVLYTTIEYGATRNEDGNYTWQPNEKAVLVTGIANPQPLVQYLNSRHIDIIKQFEFKDHYSYTLRDIQQMLDYQNANDGVKIVMTEKDWVKVVPLLRELNLSKGWYYVPIQIGIYSDQQQLLNTVETKIIDRLNRLTQHT